MPASPDIRDHFLDSRWSTRFEDEVLLVAHKLKGKVRALRGDWEKDQFVLRAEVAGEPIPADLDFPTIDDGVEGMAFIETVVKSSKQGAKWVRFPRL